MRQGKAHRPRLDTDPPSCRLAIPPCAEWFRTPDPLPRSGCAWPWRPLCWWCPANRPAGHTPRRKTSYRAPWTTSVNFLADPGQLIRSRYNVAGRVEPDRSFGKIVNLGVVKPVFSHYRVDSLLVRGVNGHHEVLDSVLLAAELVFIPGKLFHLGR